MKTFTQEELNHFKTVQDWAKKEKAQFKDKISPIAYMGLPKAVGHKTVQDIKDLCVKVYGIPFNEINVKTRKREIVEIRQALSWFFRFKSELPLKKIGEIWTAFNHKTKDGYKVFGQDHSTIIHAIKTYEDIMSQVPYLKAGHSKMLGLLKKGETNVEKPS